MLLQHTTTKKVPNELVAKSRQQMVTTATISIANVQHNMLIFVVSVIIIIVVVVVVICLPLLSSCALAQNFLFSLLFRAVLFSCINEIYKDVWQYF